MRPGLENLAIYWRARALSLPEVLVMLGVWLCPMAVVGLGVPLRRDGSDLPAEINSFAVLAFVIPVAALLRLLDEGPNGLVRTRRRGLALLRVVVAAVTILLTGALALVIAAVVSLPSRHVVALAIAQSAMGVAASTVIGSSRGWLVPGALTLLATAPGLVPWPANLVYNAQQTTALARLAGLLSVVAVAAYGRWGLAAAREAAG